MKKTQKSQVYVYDGTLAADKFGDTTQDVLISYLQKHCKKAVWQLEKGKKNGYLHYQIRISLKEKKFLHQLDPECKITFSITSDENKNNDFYVMKEDTRVDGPWKLEDFPIKIETTQLKIFKGFALRPYQETILEEIKKFDMRSIDLIYDTVGNVGKSIFSEYCEYLNLVEEVPPFRLMEDIFQWVYGMPKKKAYFIDMPRGMKKDKLGEFYAGIEVIKNGVAYDKRNYAKKCRFDRPRIFIFTNTLPNFELMSKDRWKVWNVNMKYELEPYDICSIVSDLE